MRRVPDIRQAVRKKLQRISPAEAVILLDPKTSSGQDPLKIALFSLLARGAIQLEKRTSCRAIWFKKNSPYLLVGSATNLNLPPYADALLHMVRQAHDLNLREFVDLAHKHFGGNFGEFRTGWVLPTLVEQGLLQTKEKKVLGVIPRTAIKYTPAGLDERIRIEATLMKARTIPKLLKADPKQAVSAILAVGSLHMLIEELRPFYCDLSRAMREHATIYTSEKDSDWVGCDPDGLDALGVGAAEIEAALYIDTSSSFDSGVGSGTYDADSFGDIGE
jgi:hypothetical protein